MALFWPLDANMPGMAMASGFTFPTPVVLRQRTQVTERGSTLRVFCGKSRRDESPMLLRSAVSAATELLRALGGPSSTTSVNDAVEADSNLQSDDVLGVLKSDYQRAYFLTGDFTSGIYTEDCFFADPTIRFTGKELYRRNLKLLVPFYEDPSLTLLSIEERFEGDLKVIEASWQLRTYIKLPWRPLISLDGSTEYELNSSSKITKHVESWSISPMQAILQLFVPSKKTL